MSNWTIKEHFNLPENWDVLRLNDLTTQIVDGTHFTPNYIENGIPFLRVTDIQTKNIDFAGLKFISKEEHDFLKLRCSPGKGDILLSKNGTIGLIKIVDWDWEFSIFVSLALIKTKKEIYNQYLKYLLQSEIVWWQIKLRAKQGTVLNLHLEEIRDLEIPKAPYEDQVKIAKILSTADAVIEKTQAAIDKYKAIKQGMLHDLFTRGIDISTGKLRPKYEDAPELYKESKLGWVPKEWEVEESCNVVRFINGRAYSIHEWETTGIPVIRLQNLTGSGETYYYSNLELPENQYCKKGDLLYMWSATFGPHIWKGDKAIFHYHIWKVECSKKMLQQYYYYDLLRFTETVLEGANGSTMAHITKEAMDKRLTITPAIDEQKHITNKLLSVDNQLQTEQKYLLKLQQLKTGLMGDLLSGKKRVTIKEEEMT